MKDRTKNTKEKIVNNFLSTLDLSLEPREHYHNVARDARLYEWDSEIITAILKGVERAYCFEDIKKCI